MPSVDAFVEVAHLGTRPGLKQLLANWASKPRFALAADRKRQGKVPDTFYSLDTFYSSPTGPRNHASPSRPTEKGKERFLTPFIPAPFLLSSLLFSQTHTHRTSATDFHVLPSDFTLRRLPPSSRSLTAATMRVYGNDAHDAAV